MDVATWAVTNAEKVGVIFLLLVAVGIGWRLLLKSEERTRACEAARLEDAKSDGEIRERLGKLEGKIEGVEKERDAHIKWMSDMMTKSLELVKKD